ncbi:MAG: M20/M25/M40 family metallo-hydrolase [Tabrizicola sp.]|uniref:M42 family metallopeptidase n=1 Tax=Tabrizicola sp. TaxID=2005166 RepID=UPI002736DFFE|nr:M20/M25/M40 family metallo-hydrolase [Tabrizicola sp.]MDP3262840.1 M20/M25/M40 family metallo-hydrolase [Tabrizicola sp.]MDP3649037.1 M20/M25/M40 family metallo-hydrolase [Paracoccaceae bacterium]MDZ4068772.1 M20/M25/M40 family metallo-hydrolase [Tabrizicola sp.]
MPPMRDLLTELMLIPGLSGYEARVARAIATHLDALGLPHTSDRLGNLSCTIPGDPALPPVMIFTHMDQLGFIVRKIEPSGLIRLERLGGVPERALPSQAVVLSTDNGDIPGVIANKSHHATTPDEKYKVLPYADLYVDAGFASKPEAEAAGVRIGTPVTYLPRVVPLAGTRLAGTSVDDRAGCAVLLALARARQAKPGPTLHLVWSVQEEFNLRGVLPAATALAPAIALQIDLLLACDTPDMTARGDVTLGGGPGISLYSFHGRGTLNGVIPHPALVRLMEDAATAANLPLQRSAHTGALTDLSYLQFMGPEGIACLDVGFPMRYSHSSLEVVDLTDLDALTTLLDTALDHITPALQLTRHA